MKPILFCCLLHWPKEKITVTALPWKLVILQMGNNLDPPPKKKTASPEEQKLIFFFFAVYNKENNNCDIFQRGRLIWVKIKGENETTLS